ncbi:hypothetical protein [Ureibacillus acetophenoni]
MEDEIFGPILPIMAYDHLQSAIEQIRRPPHACSLFLL